MQPLTDDSLKDLNSGDRVRLVGNGVRETFQACKLGRIQYLISLKYGYEYTRPQLIDKYRRALCEFEISRIPENGWEA